MKHAKQWVIVYNDIDNEDDLKVSTETISGKNANDALTKRFKMKFRKLILPSSIVKCNVILVEGFCVDGVIQHTGTKGGVAYKAVKGKQLCSS